MADMSDRERERIKKALREELDRRSDPAERRPRSGKAEERKESFWDKAKRLDRAYKDSYLSNISSGVQSGAYNVLGMPVDYTNMGLRGAGYMADKGLGLMGVDPVVERAIAPDRPVGGAQWLKDNLKPAYEPKANTLGKKVAKIGAEYATENALLAAMIAARGAKLASRGMGGVPARTAPAARVAGRQTVGSSTSALDDVALAAHRSPGVLAKTTAGGTVGEVAGGIGGGFIDQLAGGDGSIGTNIGRLLGGTAGSLATSGGPRQKIGQSVDEMRADATAIYDRLNDPRRAIPGNWAGQLRQYMEMRGRQMGLLGPDGKWKYSWAKEMMDNLDAHATNNAPIDFRRYKTLKGTLDDAWADAAGATKPKGAEKFAAAELGSVWRDIGYRLWGDDLRSADDLWARAERHRELVDLPTEGGTLRGKKNFTGAGKTHGRQIEYGQLAKKVVDDRLVGVPAAEKAAVYDLGAGDMPGYAFMRNMGRWAPSGPMAAVTGYGTGAVPGATVGGFLAGPPGATIGATVGGAGASTAGAIGRRAAWKIQDKAIADLSNLIRTGQHMPEPYLLPQTKAALLATILNNQDDPDPRGRYPTR